MGKVQEGSRSESKQAQLSCQVRVPSACSERQILFEADPVFWWIFDFPKILRGIEFEAKNQCVLETFLPSRMQPLVCGAGSAARVVARCVGK